jgi:hypothetical protein
MFHAPFLLLCFAVRLLLDLCSASFLLLSSNVTSLTYLFPTRTTSSPSSTVLGDLSPNTMGSRRPRLLLPVTSTEAVQESVIEEHPEPSATSLVSVPAPSTTNSVPEVALGAVQESVLEEHSEPSATSLVLVPAPTTTTSVPEMALGAASISILRELAYGKSVEPEGSSDAVASLVPSGSEDVNEWAQFMRTSTVLYGDESMTESIRSLSTNTKAYGNEKLVYILRFFNILSTLPSFQKLTLPATTEEGTTTLLFFKMIQGVKTDAKKVLLNSALVAFGQLIRKKDYPDGTDISHLSELERAQIMYQPNVLQKIFKHLFKVFKDNSIMFTQSDFTSVHGSYKAFFVEAIKDTKKLRPDDYGTKPNQAGVEMSDDRKMHECADPPLYPFSVFGDNLMILSYKLSRDVQLRGGDEVCFCCIVLSHFTFLFLI